MSKAEFRHVLSADRTMPGSRAREGEQRLEGARGRHCSSQRQCSCTRGVLVGFYAPILLVSELKCSRLARKHGDDGSRCWASFVSRKRYRGVPDLNQTSYYLVYEALCFSPSSVSCKIRLSSSFVILGSDPSRPSVKLVTELGMRIMCLPNYTSPIRINQLQLFSFAKDVRLA